MDNKSTIDNERALCGCLISEMEINGDNVEILINACIDGGLTTDAFSDNASRAVYSAMLRLPIEGKIYSTVALAESMRNAGTLETIGGVAMIGAMADMAGGFSHGAKYYLNRVLDAYSRRKAERILKDCQNAINNPISSVDFEIGKLETALQSINTRHTQKPFSTIIQEVGEKMIREINAPTMFNGLSTGYNGLDYFINGMKKGQLLLIAARPGIGKTSLAMNIAECVALGVAIDGTPLKGEPQINPQTNQKPCVLIFSLEMSVEELSERMIYSNAGVAKPKCMQPTETAKAMAKKTLIATEKLANAPIVIISRGGLDILEIMQTIKRVNRVRGVSLVVVDYIQLAHAKEYKSQSKTLEIGAITGGLKSVALEIGVPIIALSQFNRAAEMSETPSLHNLRDSGSIEQDCDIAILLSRNAKTQVNNTDTLMTRAEIAKNRSGKTGVAWLKFNGAITRYYDTTQEERAAIKA